MWPTRPESGSSHENVAGGHAVSAPVRPGAAPRSRLRYRIFAAILGVLGAVLSGASFWIHRAAPLGRVALTVDGAASLVVGLAFTAIAVICVWHYGRRSAELSAAYHDLHRAIVQRERSEAALRESERFVRATVDSIDSMIAVLDADGVIMAVNRAWRVRSDGRVGPAGLCDIGTNYLVACEGVSGGAAAEARRLAGGIREVLSGARTEVLIESEVPEAAHWLTRAARFPGHGPIRVVLTHQDVTSWKAAHRTVEPEGERSGAVVDAAASRTEELLRAFLPGLRLDGVVFFETLVSQLTAALGVEIGAVVLLEPDGHTARTVALGVDGGLALNATYAIAGTPCHEVVTTRVPRTIPHGVPAAYPGARLLQELGVVAYAGVPLADATGRTMGILVAGSRRPFPDPGRVEEVLRLLGVPTANELERQRRERDLRLAEFSVEHASVGTYWVGRGGEILRVNRATCEMLGYSEAELLGMTIYDLDPALTPERWQAHRETLRVRRSTREQRGLRRKDGTAVPIEADVNLLDFEGQEYGVVFVRDVADRQEAEGRVDRERAFLRQVIDLAPSLIFAKDRVGRFMLANTATAEAYGTSVEAMIGRTDAIFMPDAECVETSRRQDRQVMETGGELTIAEDRFFDRAGVERCMRTVERPIVSPDGSADMVVGVSVDITEHKRQEHELRLSEERFRTLAESVPVGVFLTDAQGQCLFTNPQWHEISGLAPDESLGDGWARAIHPDDRARFLEGWGEIGAHGGARESELRMMLPSGVERWAHVRVQPLVGAAGPTGFVGSVLDVTQRKAAEREIRASNAELEQRIEQRTRERDRFFGLSPDMLCIADATHFVAVNPAFTEVLGYETAELLARPYLDLIHPDDRGATQRQADRRVAGERVLQFENRCRHRDGSWRWISWMALPDGPDVVYASGRDVTELKQAEEARRRAADDVRDLYDNAPCGYHSLDGDGVIVAINETELGWLGRSRDELVGRTRYDELMTPECARRFRETFPQFRKSGWVSNLELDLVRKDGSIFPASLSATAVFDEEGRYVRSRSTLVDVSERRATAERVETLQGRLEERAAELEKANRELESFSHSVSHDLRAPLRAIDGFARILGEEHGPRLDDEGQRSIGIIRENARRMAQRIDALLALSRVGRRRLERGRVDMGVLVRTMVDEARRLEPGREVAVTIDGIAPAVGDATLLRQLFANLIDNAFKYTGKVAHPCIDVGSVDVAGERVYYVRDNGAGFDMQYVDKLFRVFERLHDPLDFEGTGVGLAIVQRIVERHGGRVWAEGRVGEGAIVYFTLGCEPVEEAASPTPAAEDGDVPEDRRA